MNESGLRRTLPEQFSESGHTFGTLRHPSVTNPILSKRVCFYKSGDPQFNGLRMVINNRTFKTFDALLDSLSKKVPLPFGVRNITTPQGVHAVYSLDELEDGKSYICSDSRKVKPINLAVARRKPPPWYHARPVSSRRRTVQQARLYPGHKLHKQESVVMRTPKKLLVFRNGDPSVKRIVVLQKRTTPTFESILGYISQLMQFNVVKLHTPDGRRVDGLPGLIMCSGTVVAAGREKFKSANYNAEKSVGPTRIGRNRMGVRRVKALNRKKKSLKPRIFSPSSERYIVSQIHNSIAGSSYSNPTNSIEMESNRILESVAESEAEHFLGDGAEGQDCFLPTDDDIEKSFRVNQDGSMTVEMRVRLTIKEEETIHWTTTLSRSCVANQLNADCLPAPEPEQELSLLESDPVDLQPPTATSFTSNKNKDDNDKDPPSLSNGAYSEGSIDEDNVKAHAEIVSPLRTPTPGQKQVRTKQASVESIKSLMADGVQEDIVGSYSYTEHIENGDLTEQYSMVKQSRPVPKPRRVGSVDANNSNVSTYRSAGMAEILQVDSSGDEVTETVFHIYEQQTCQDNYLANFCAQSMSTSAVTFSRPATSETGHHSSNSDFEPQPCRPATASESVSIWCSESISLKSDLTTPLLNTDPLHRLNIQPLSREPTKSQNKMKAKDITKERRGSPKHKGPIKKGNRLMSPGNKQKNRSANGKSKKVKPFSSVWFINRIYGNKSKSTKNTIKLKKRQNAVAGVAAKALPHSDEDKSELKIPPSEPRGTLTRQTSMHQEKKSPNDSCSFNENMTLPTLSNSGTNGYVEDWLEKAHCKPPIHPEGEGKAYVDKLENDPCLMSVAERVKCLKEKTQIESTSAAPPPELSRSGSVKQRIKSFENKRQTVSKDSQKSSLEKNSNEVKLNSICYETNPTEIPSEIDNKSALIILQFQETSPSLSMDLPPPPTAETLLELSTLEHGMDASAASSPLYRLSSVSDIHPLSMSPASDKAISPTDHTVEMASSIQTDNPSELREAPLQRAPSIKRAPLVSNLSLERKMSLKKASLDKYTLYSDSTSLPITTAGDNARPNGICLTDTQQAPAEGQQSKSLFDLESHQSCCTSASPASLTSEERASSRSILSSEAPNTVKESNEKESLPPKPLVKKVKLIGSPSPERKPQTKKQSSEITKSSPRLSSLNNHPVDKNASPNLGRKKATTPTASPASEKRQILHKSKLSNKPSPYSQSLDLASPPVKQKSYKKLLHRNLSSDSTLEASHKTQRKSSSQRKPQETSQRPTESIKSNQVEKTQRSDSTIGLQNAPADDDFLKADQERAVVPRPLNITNEPNMKPVLEKICFSIKSIRQITQSKRHSCLEKSNSLPDFSSHVASTFGSSSKALLAFLSVMTLKEGMPKLDVEGLNANNVSCAEALKMIDSLREIASIEESQNLQNSLSHLRQSASQQLLHSWRGFQDFSEKCKSRGSSPNTVDQDCLKSTSPAQVEENVIDEIMDNLEMPEVLKEELASFSIGNNSDSDNEESSTEKESTQHQSRISFSPASEVDTEDMQANQLQVLNADSTAESYEEATVSENMSSANKILDQKHSESLLEAQQPNISEERDEPELAVPESQESEQEETLAPHCYVELNTSKTQHGSCPDSESRPTRDKATDPETKQQTYTSAMELYGSTDETTTTDMDELSSSEGDGAEPDVVSKELKIIIEETLSEEEQEAEVSEIIKDQSNFKESDLEEDSGNDHSSCDEQADLDTTKNNREIRTSTEEELSYDEKELSSEDESPDMDSYMKETYCQAKLSADEKIENIAKKLCDEVISQSVAERVIFLEKKVANGHSSGIMSPSHRKAYLASDGEESSSESPTSQLTPCIRSAPQSSLSFSYDSSSVITTQPESNRVRSIREMFLAKSTTDIHQGQKRNSSPNPSDMTELRAETSVSGGYQSQTSSELSSGEDDSSRKSITKGFVRRTIERLYGKKESPAQVDTSDRPPSAHTQKKREHTSMFSPFHAARSKAMSELSYFSSTNAVDTLNEATRCIAFNAQVGPGGSVPIDEGRWLLKESTVMRKSVSDPVAINKTLTSTTQEDEKLCKDTEEKTPYSLFKTDSEVHQKSLSRKCTYFSLPHANDSDVGQEETVSGKDGDSVGEPRDSQEDTKMGAEKNGKLPGLVITDFKIVDNKVHPLVEVPPDGKAVVVQPVRGQGVVNRRLQEPDMLDVLYNFCGEHCPIL